MKPDLIPLSQLMEYPRNPKDHDVGVIDGLIDQLGFIDRIVINTVTGHMLAGHGRRKTLLQKAKAGEAPPENIELLDGEWLVPVDFVNVSEDKEAIAIVGLNRSTELGGWDDLLAYTGYDGDDLDHFQHMLAAPSLGDLSDQYGDYDESNLWPVIRAQVRPELFHVFEQLEGDDHNEKMTTLLNGLI